VTTNPTNSWFWHMLFTNADGGTLSCEVKIRLTYYCRFEHPTESVLEDA